MTWTNRLRLYGGILVVLVVVNDPTRGIFGGTVAAPAFAAIAKFDLQHLNVPPDHPVAPAH